MPKRQSGKTTGQPKTLGGKGVSSIAVIFGSKK